MNKMKNMFCQKYQFKSFDKIFNMNQKVFASAQQAMRLKDSKSQKFLRATISPKVSSKQLAHRKSAKRQKSEKKGSQVKSKKQIQLLSNYFDREEYLESEAGNQEYYYNQATNKNSKKNSRVDKDPIQFSKSKHNSLQAEIITKNNSQLKKTDSLFSQGKIKLSQMKGVINFDGKYVKVVTEQQCKKNNHFITDSNSNYTDIWNGDRDQEGRNKKKKRKQRSGNKINEKKIKSKSKSKNQQLKKKVTGLRQSLDNESATLLKKYKMKEKEDGETEPSPNQLVIYERTEIIDYEDIQIQIEEELANSRKVSIPKCCIGERMKCINMMSRICGELQFRKQTFAQAILLFDRYLNDQIIGTKMKTIGLAALILSLKLEETETAAAFQFQIITANSCSYAREIRTSFPLRDKKSDEHRSCSKRKWKKEATVSRVGEDNIYSRVTSLSIILGDQFGNQIIPKNQLIQYESLIIMKLAFKLRCKTYGYWVDLLTVIWDKKIISRHQLSEKLLFRCAKYRTNMSYLQQMLQIAYYDPQVYMHSEVTLVLSVMYLLIRITMEKDPEGYSNYRKMLQKSSNVLFIDNVGCNKLFGEFLQLLSMEMGQILLCCQYVSHFLCPTLMKKHSISGMEGHHYDYTLSFHTYNPELFKYTQN